MKVTLSERKTEREKETTFSQNYWQKLALGALKMCLRWHFSPPQKPQERGERQDEEGV